MNFYDDRERQRRQKRTNFCQNISKRSSAQVSYKLLKTRFVKQVYTLSTQDVTESTSESTDGSSTITTTLPPTTTTEIMIAADSSSELIVNVKKTFPNNYIRLE